MPKPSLKSVIVSGGRLLLTGSYQFSFDQLPFFYVNLSFKRRLNLVAQGISLLSRSRHPIGIPVIVQVEPTNRCNLRCLTCPTGAKLMQRPKAMMPFDTFRRVIDQIKDSAYLLVFWSWGEPFMHPDAFRMIRYAKNCGLLVHTSTNGHFFDTRDRAREVVASGLDSIIFAVDGLDQETYQTYRIGGDFNRVRASIENLVSVRARSRARSPRITFRFIVMKHNQHQVPEVKDFAKKLGVDAVSFRSALVKRPAIDLEEVLLPGEEKYQRYAYRATPSGSPALSMKDFHCHRPYANLTVFSNGDVVACENDFDGKTVFGNVSDQPLRKILFSTQAHAFFGKFRKTPDNFSYCRACEFREMQHESATVETEVFGGAPTPRCGKTEGAL